MEQRSTPKRQKQESCTSDTTTTTTTTTMVNPLLEQQTPKQKEKHEASSKPTHSTCESCKQTLPQHLFPKKKFNKNQDSIICRQCKKNQNAKRCKQPTKSQTKQGRKNDAGVVRRPNNFGYCNYVDQLFSLDCFPDIVALKAFTSAKDVSESMGAIQAACQHGLLKDDDVKNAKKNVMCLCIGDGSTPRTAVLACFLKKWECISIDPALHEEWTGSNPKGIRGLTGFGGTLEDFLMKNNKQHDDSSSVVGTSYDHLILLCVHSHAPLVGNASIPNIMAQYNNIPTTLISLPCCPKFRSQKDVGRVPDIHYEDDCVFSACRRVEVWTFDYTKCIVIDGE